VSCFHFRAAVSVHVGSAQSYPENGVSIQMCSAVEIAWLAQNRDAGTAAGKWRSKGVEGNGSL